MQMSTDFEQDFDFSGDDIDRDGTGGQVAEGSYCFQVTDVVPHTDNSGDMMVEMEVLSGTVPTEVGKKHHEYFRYPDPDLSDQANGVRRTILRQLFYALALTSPEELKANPKFHVDLALALGRMCCGKIKHESYKAGNGEQKSKAVLFKKGAWDLWALDSPKAAGIPLPSSNGDGEPGDLQLAGALGDDLDDLIG